MGTRVPRVYKLVKTIVLGRDSLFYKKDWWSLYPPLPPPKKIVSCWYDPQITTYTGNRMNQSELEANPCCQARENAKRVSFGLVILLTGKKPGARIFGQSQSVAMQNQSDRELTFVLVWLYF